MDTQSFSDTELRFYATLGHSSIDVVRGPSGAALPLIPLNTTNYDVIPNRVPRCRCCQALTPEP